MYAERYFDRFDDCRSDGGLVDSRGAAPDRAHTEAWFLREWWVSGTARAGEPHVQAAS